VATGETTRLARRIAIVGIGETRYERRASRPLMALLLEAARAALDDAGLTARDVDGIIAPGTTYAELHELARELGVRRQFFNAAGYSGGAAVARPRSWPRSPSRRGWRRRCSACADSHGERSARETWASCTPRCR